MYGDATRSFLRWSRCLAAANSRACRSCPGSMAQRIRYPGGVRWSIALVWLAGAGCGRLGFPQRASGDDGGGANDVGGDGDGAPAVECWSAWRTGTPVLSAPVRVDAVDSSLLETDPTLSSDGLTLYLDSRPDGQARPLRGDPPRSRVAVRRPPGDPARSTIRSRTTPGFGHRRWPRWRVLVDPFGGQLRPVRGRTRHAVRAVRRSHGRGVLADNSASTEESIPS